MYHVTDKGLHVGYYGQGNSLLITNGGQVTSTTDFSVGDFSSSSCRDKKCRNASSSCPATFSQRSLRDQLNFKFTRKQLSFKL